MDHTCYTDRKYFIHNENIHIKSESPQEKPALKARNYCEAGPQ